MRLAGDRHPVFSVGLHGALKPGEKGEGRGVALAGAGRALDQQDRIAAVPADVVPLARLEVVQRAGLVHGLQAGQEAGLAGSRLIGLRYVHRACDLRVGDAIIEHVEARLSAFHGLAQLLDDGRTETAVPVVRTMIEGAEIAVLAAPSSCR